MEPFFITTGKGLFVYKKVLAATIIGAALAGSAGGALLLNPSHAPVTAASPGASVATDGIAALGSSGASVQGFGANSQASGLHGLSSGTYSQGGANGLGGWRVPLAGPAGRGAFGGRGGLGGRFFGGRAGGLMSLRGGRGPILTVTAINGNIINTTLMNMRAVTVTVSATTAYTEAGVAASLSDIHVGSHITGRGARTAPATIAATSIQIVLPQVVGVVTAVNGSTLTLTGADAAPHTVTVTGSTRYVRNGQGAALVDIAVGSAIRVEGTANADGSLTAVRIQIALPRVVGTVSAVNGSSLTITDRWGIAHAVTTSAATVYSTRGGATASASSLTTGTRVLAQGTMSADGKTLDALRIVVLPAARGMGRGLGWSGNGGAGFGQIAPPSFGGTPFSGTPGSNGVNANGSMAGSV